MNYESAEGGNNEQIWSTKNNLIMQNEPNFKKAKINITPAKIKDYENNWLLECPKNEPNSNPILSTDLSIDQFEQNMQNEPNFKKTKTNITSAKIKDYENKRLAGHRKNEPNSNPASTDFRITGYKNGWGKF